MVYEAMKHSLLRDGRILIMDFIYEEIDLGNLSFHDDRESWRLKLSEYLQENLLYQDVSEHTRMRGLLHQYC